MAEGRARQEAQKRAFVVTVVVKCLEKPSIGGLVQVPSIKESGKVRWTAGVIDGVQLAEAERP